MKGVEQLGSAGSPSTQEGGVASHSSLAVSEDMKWRCKRVAVQWNGSQIIKTVVKSIIISENVDFLKG